MYDSDEDASFVVLTPPAAMMYHQVQFNIVSTLFLWLYDSRWRMLISQYYLFNIFLIIIIELKK